MSEYTMEKILRSVQKPARYVGGELGSVVKNKKDVKLRFAFCFPDTYEVGMSHLGLKILYYIKNNEPDIWCERAFAPWFDMREKMLENDIPLFALESKDPLFEFDIVGFTLQYEMSYTNILYMLDLARIPLRSANRKDSDPIIVAGGPCACNPEPIADFIDLFILGDGEEVNLELCRLVIECKQKKLTRNETLRLASQIDGIYVPSLYNVEYGDDLKIKSVSPIFDAPITVKKRIVKNLDSAAFPSYMPVPMIETIHDRASIEVLRGCVRGCRFCQAGFIYRPFRPRSAELLDKQARALCDSTGYEEISLISLSTSDHPQLEELLDKLLTWTQDKNINLSLPSLRVDNFNERLVEKISRVRHSGLTFAPEAGTQRLRNVINKNIDEEEIMQGCKTAFEGGYTSVKLYFMMGLPTETDEDILAITALAQRIVDMYYELPSKQKGKSVNVAISVACFIPKPFTPFQFFAQDTVDEFKRKQRLLVQSIRSRKITISWHDALTSSVEAVLARGDRRLSQVILDVYMDGGIFDSWDEGFSYERWQRAFDKNNIDTSFYANRPREAEEIMPWDMFDYGVTKKFLAAEYKKSITAEVTPKCTDKCSNCGMAKFMGGACVAKP
ncbi:MAG: TIGR03960 family B12-binding radical SAM protein [Oscillospiraceae bacterium]